MTVSTLFNKEIATGNGVATSFPFNFGTLPTPDLVVSLFDLDNVEIPQIEGGDYSITGAGREDGGAVVFNVPPPDQYTVLIQRIIPLTQPTDIKNQGSFYPRTVERAFGDRNVFIDQQQQERIDAALKLPPQVVGVSTVLPVAVPFNLLRWNVDANALENAVPPEIATLADDTVSDPKVAANAGIQATKLAFTQSGTGAVSRTIDSKLQDSVSVFDFMTAAQVANVKANLGTLDVTAAIQAAVTAHQRVHAPAGTYLMSSVVSIPIGHELFGAGWLSTLMVRAGANLSFFALGANGSISDMGFNRTGATVATSGRLIDGYGASGASVSNIRSSHCWDGIYIENVAGFFMDRIYVNNWQYSGINIAGTTNDVFLDHFILTHGGGTVGAGIRMFNKAEAITVSNGDIIGGQYSIYADATTFAPGTASIPAFSKFTDVYCDSAVFGVVLDKSALLRFTNCWFSNRPNHGAQIKQVYDCAFVNCVFANCGSSGALLQNTGQKNTKFIGCTFTSNNSQNNGSNGISVDAGVSGFAVIGCSSNNDNLGNAQGYGLFVAAGASDNYVVIGNNFTGNALGAVSDGGTGTNKKIDGNIGYTPPFIAPTYQTTWANFGSGYQNGGYRKDADGFVSLGGTVAGGASPSAIFTLPAGFRPAGQLVYPINTSSGFGRLDIKANGSVELTTGGTASVTLDGIRFPAA